MSLARWTLQVVALCILLASLASAQGARPSWTNREEPEASGKVLTFVGLSYPSATEREARDDALRNATERVVEYLGTTAESAFEEKRVSFGLTSQVVDPTRATQAFTKQFAKNLATRLRPLEWYTEQETSPQGKKFVVFVRAAIPINSINDSFQQSAKQQQDAAEQQARQVSDDKAKQQAASAAQFWADMGKSGLIPEPKE